MLFSCYAAQAPKPDADLRGIYVDRNAFPPSAENNAALSEALNVPGVDVLVLVLGWTVSEQVLHRRSFTRRRFHSIPFAAPSRQFEDDTSLDLWCLNKSERITKLR